MKKIALYIGILFGLVLASCSEADKEIPTPNKPENNTPKPETPVIREREVMFTTEVQTRACTNVVQEISEDQSLGVMMVYSTDTTSNGIKEAIHSNGLWKGKQSIFIKENDQAQLYAFYPYNSSVTSGKAIPVEMNSQTDYLYAKATSISYSSPNGKVTFNHALSILSFNIDKNVYSGKGMLKSIRIEGDDFYTEGTMDVSTGVISGTKKGTFTLEKEYTLAQGGWTEDLPDFFCLPTNVVADKVKLTFQIDDKSYSCTLPKMGIVGGTKYIVRLTLTNNGISINEKDGIESVSMTNDTDSMEVERGAYGAISIQHINAKFLVPTLLSQNGFIATINWGDNSTEPYADELTHTYATEGTHTVTIESYGAEEITFKNMVGISQIDLSKF